MKVTIEKAGVLHSKTIAQYTRDMVLFAEKLGWHKANRSQKEWKSLASRIKKDMKADRTRVFLIAKVDSRVVGFSEAVIQEVSRVFKPKKLLNISAVHVEEGYRNRGIGRKLIAQLVEWGMGFSVEEITLEVHVKNPAMKLYEKMGFRISRLEMVRKVKLIRKKRD